MTNTSSPDTSSPDQTPHNSGQDSSGYRPPIKMRLHHLREMLNHLNLDGFLVPMTDEYQNEYVPPSAQRVAFITGFTGSAGTAIILKDRAAFFTDGRYTLQANMQIDPALFQIYDIYEKTPTAWLIENTSQDQKIGYDAWLHTEPSIEKISITLLKNGASLLPVKNNPIDEIWDNKPEPLCAPILSHDIMYAGKSSADKRKEIAQILTTQDRDAVVLTDSTSIAWILNIRGGDVPHAPLPLSFAILGQDERLDWFVDSKKISPGLENHLGPDIRIHAPEDFLKTLEQMGREEKTIQIDTTEASMAIVKCLRDTGTCVINDEDPCLLPKACKNNIELNGMRAAHKRDGVALVKLLAWLDEAMDKTPPTELDVEEQLESFRRSNNLYQGPSFATIAGAGENAAIVHYRATNQSNKKLEHGSFLLLDSGGQYLDGTTDVTRTIPLLARSNKSAPPISQEMKDRYTRVLKGHIALASIKFPTGTTGAELDVLARQYLWQIGCDYAHGTGHGVGSYLSVHEGPQGISRRNTVPLKAGMVLSNEPGYYKQGAYGIRLENLVAVVESPDIILKTRQMLGFETLTLAPFDTRALDISMLTAPERDWLNTYHAQIFRALLPLLDEKTTQWLKIATSAQ